MIEPLNEDIVACNCGYKTKNNDKLIARYVNFEITFRHNKMLGSNIDTFGTYSASILKRVFLELGGFDTKYRTASAEDFDFGYRIAKKYTIFFTDKTFVYHYHPDSLIKYLRQQFWRGYWRVELYTKNKNKITSGDSYSGHEAQYQFLITNLFFISLPFLFINILIPSLFLLLLIITNIPLGIWIFPQERKFLVLAPIIASLRSIVGSMGAYNNVIRKVFG